MSNTQICFRKLHRYKYQLMEDYSVNIDIQPAADIVTDFITLSTSGDLVINNRYAWDGASGPVIDTRSVMRASLIHDALYQLMRGQWLDQSYREYADRLMKEMCLADGMWGFRAAYIYWAIHTFGAAGAKPPAVPEDERRYAP